MPEKLVAELAKQEAITVNVWKKAKAQKNFSLFKADLQKLLDLSKQAAEILMKVKETKTPYEALIDNFEPKMTADQITATFNQLQRRLKTADKQDPSQLKASQIQQYFISQFQLRTNAKLRNS